VSLADELWKLQELRQRGALTEAEYAQAKAALLKRPPVERRAAIATKGAAGPKCYACTALATTRCQSCGTLSCAQHLQSIYVSHGYGGAYELRCRACYSSAEAWKVVGCVIGGIAMVIFAIVLIAVLIAVMGRH
jgi:hypothetical protein